MNDSPENLQEFDEQEQKTVFKKRIIVIGSLVFLSAFFLVWNLFLNFGTLKISGAVPFSVSIFEEKSVECSKSPCEIKLKRGEKNISIYKIGYESFGASVEIKLWESVEIKPFFNLIPYLSKIEAFEGEKFIPETKIYELKYDEKTGNYVLQDPEAKVRKGLSYFPAKLQNPVVFGSTGSSLVIEQPGNAYFIDIITGERRVIGELKDSQKVKAAKPSGDGRSYLVLIEENNSEKIFLANKKSFAEMSDSQSFEMAVFTPMNKIIAVSKDSIYLMDTSKYTKKILTGIEDKKIIQIFANTKGGLFFESEESDGVATKFKIIY